MGGICFDLNIWSCASESLTKSQLLNKHGEIDAARQRRVAYRGQQSPGNIRLYWTASTFCSGFVQYKRVRDESAIQD